MRAGIAENESERLAALYRYEVLDTPPEANFDLITSLAASVFGAPMALITLIDPDRQSFKSRYGLSVTETPRDDAFCAHAILSSDVLVVPDAATDARFVDNPLVLHDPKIRFYAGAPLETADGFRLGTLCVMDREPRLPEPRQIKALQALARQVIELLEFHRAKRELVAVRDELSARSRELNASEARFSAFMEHNPCVAYIKDATGQVLYANRYSEELWRQPPGYWIGKTTDELFGPEIAARVRKVDEALLSSDQPGQMTEAFTKPDGTLRDFLLTKFSFPDGSGGRALGGFAVDITERLANEKRLLAAERRYREFFERNPVPSCIYRVSDLRIIDINQAAIDQYGWSREEFLSMAVTAIRATGENGSVEEYLQQLASDLASSKPIRHRRKDKSDIWVELSSIELEIDGCPARLGMAIDVTERVEAQSHLEGLVAQRTVELQKSEARWRGLVESLPQFVWSTTPDGLCDYMSQEWADYTGVPTAELLGMGWAKTLHPDDPKRLEPKWKLALETGIGRDLEYRIRAKDGSYRWFISRQRPIRAGEDGPITQWLGTSTDIDDQKRSETRLESAVAERTLALEEARERAESATRAKSDFLAVISHELRTPLNGVLGMAYLLEDTPLTEEQQTYLNTLHSSGESLLTVIDQVLDFSKIEAGKMSLASEEFTLRTVLEESLDSVWPAATAKDLRLCLDLADDAPYSVIGDRGRLRQVLLNLLSNGVKFTEHGEVLLAVACETTPEERLKLHFSVKDTGIGLSPEQLGRLFQPFTQADSSNTRRFGGTGLGLSIVKRLVELMGGTLGVSSQPSEGSTFWFELCLGQGSSMAIDVEAAAAPDAPKHAGLSGLFSHCDVRILLAEDNISNQQVALGILKKMGLQADTADDGAKALAALASVPYDLVLMDVRMPGTDGLEATREIRKAELTGQTRHLPVIAMTASAMASDVEKCRAAGMDDFIAKPFLPQTLADILKKWLPGGNGNEANVESMTPPQWTVADSKVFDMTSLLGRLMGDERLAGRVLDGFLGDMPRQIQTLARFVEGGNAREIEDQAHRIKGAAAAVSGEEMRAVALEMELAGKAGNVAVARERIGTLATQFERLQEAIKANR